MFCEVRLSEVFFTIPLPVTHSGLDFLSNVRQEQSEEAAKMRAEQPELTII